MTIMIPVDEETARLVERLAEASGRPSIDVVRDAVVASALAAGFDAIRARPTAEEKFALGLAISERSRARPILTDRNTEPNPAIGVVDGGRSPRGIASTCDR